MRHGEQEPLQLWLGVFIDARTHIEAGLALYDSYQSRAALPRYGDPAVMGLSHLALALWMLGYPEQAEQKIQQALTLAQRLEDAVSIAYAQSNGSFLSQHRRDSVVARERAEAAIMIATDHGLPFWRAAGLLHRGWALVEQRQVTEGIREIEQGIHEWCATGAANAEPYFLTLLAAGELLNAQAKAAYKQRLQELRSELEEAQALNDFGRVDHIQQELDFLTAELTRAVGPGGSSAQGRVSRGTRPRQRHPRHQDRPQTHHHPSSHSWALSYPYDQDWLCLCVRARATVPSNVGAVRAIGNGANLERCKRFE